MQLGNNQTMSLNDLRSKVICLLKIDTMCRGDDLAQLFRHPDMLQIQSTHIRLKKLDLNSLQHGFIFNNIQNIQVFVQLQLFVLIFNEHNNMNHKIESLFLAETPSTLVV